MPAGCRKKNESIINRSRGRFDSDIETKYCRTTLRNYLQNNFIRLNGLQDPVIR